MIGGKPIAVWSLSILGVNDINPLVVLRERSYSYILSRTPHETITILITVYTS
jgi:hypothetical protein